MHNKTYDRIGRWKRRRLARYTKSRKGKEKQAGIEAFSVRESGIVIHARVRRRAVIGIHLSLGTRFDSVVSRASWC
jgi:hypothetical protein